MKISDEIKTLIQYAALDAELPISIVTGIVCQESSGVPTATRYEPGFFRRYILKIPKIGTAERKGRATSWGLMQLMGQVARERGFTGEFEKLLVPELGLYWGCRQLKVFRNTYLKEHGWAGVIAAYNAGSPRKGKDGKYVNQYYVDRVLKFASEGIDP